MFIYAMINKKEVKMNFNEYQERAGKFDTFSYEKFVAEGAKANHLGILEKVLGLAGESGEACDKIKKIIRDENGEVSELVRKELVKELGDILWYLAMVSKYLGVEFEEVAKMNIEKLQDRLERNKIHGSGDNR